MSHDSTIPSRLDPMQTMPAPLVAATPRSGRKTAQAGIGRMVLIVALALFLTAIAARFLA